MIDRLIRRLIGTAAETPDDRDTATRVAIAAVLVEAAQADDVYLDAERKVIDRILAERFDLTPEAAAALRAEGEAAQVEAADLVRFTRVLKDAIPIEDRIEVIVAVWRVVYADEQKDADESNLVRRLCGLLYVPDREAGLARQRVALGYRAPE